MTTNKERFLALVSKEKTNTLERNRARIKNREMLRESQRIALKVLARLDELDWSQKDLADKMNVRPQQISKIVSGKENFTLETLIKLQNVLDIPFFASSYEQVFQEIGELIKDWTTITTANVVLNKTSFSYSETKAVEFKHKGVPQESTIDNEFFYQCA